MKRTCTELTEEMLVAMRSDNYSHKSVDTHVKYAYSVLIRFCNEHFEGNYSVEAGDAFMASILEKELSKHHTFLYRNSIERLNHALTGDYHWRPVKNKCKPYVTSCFDSIITEYESYLVQTGKTQTHVRSHIHLVARFLAYMESAGITNVCAIRATNVHEGFHFFADKEGFQKKMKTFFRYAYKYGLIDQDISCWVPIVSRNKPISASAGSSYAKNSLNLTASLTKSYTKTETFSGPSASSAYNSRAYWVKFYQDKGTYTGQYLNDGVTAGGKESGTWTNPKYYAAYSVDSLVN